MDVAVMERLESLSDAIDYYGGHKCPSGEECCQKCAAWDRELYEHAAVWHTDA